MIKSSCRHLPKTVDCHTSYGNALKMLKKLWTSKIAENRCDLQPPLLEWPRFLRLRKSQSQQPQHLELTEKNYILTL